MARAENKKATPISELRARYGRPETRFYDTGIFLLNDLWGGGYPTGKLIEMHSLEGLGKTTIVLQMAKNLIAKHNLKVAFLDVEGALDRSLKNNLGITEHETGDMPSFLHLTPYTYDEVAKTLNILTNGEYDLVIYDSIANTSLDTDSDDEGEFKISKKIGQHSLLQGELLKLFKGKFARTGKTLIIINQMRTNIMTNPMAKGPAYKPAGGKVLDHNFDIRTSIERVEHLWNDDKVKIGAKLRITTIKNKLTYPFRQVELELIFGMGINKVSTLATVLLNKEVLKRGGAVYAFPDGYRAVGWEKVKDYIRENYAKCLSFIDDSTYQVNRDGEKVAEGTKIEEEVPELGPITPNISFDGEDTMGSENETDE